MANNRQSRAEVVLLARWARWIAALLGLALLALGVLAVAGCFPTGYEWSGAGSLVKSTRSVSDLSGIVTTLAIAGVALLVYALNGVRLVKFGAGSVVAEGSPAVESFKEHPPSEAEAKEVNVPEVEEVEPIRAPAEVLDDEMAVFELASVPSRVISDALARWPADAGDPPGTLGQFEYASRRRGRGPHPWILKFKDRTEVRVFYGGRSKSAATVKRTGS